ncbi:TetR/AcrR family transcriptional regulator [Ligilactobacillus acidipiscis]|uniref:TetR/AcrR family transcriptional regulator n=1 Tax=Ligilactobacillus acidipiscis TaxID=89059 RepID=UPI0023F75C7F|nr:TetR/AcrR family transcriptional regulator [Ligilactobacillus acidipiscis]WEV58187.1 TetR/AcrR family transcriptional regulator [Ligilactobacillus acidipiscis]
MQANLQRQLKSQKKLQKGLLHLMIQKPLNDITITELAEVSHVSRWAFYNNFDYVEEILVKYCDDLFISFYQDPICHEKRINWDQFSLYICRFAKDNAYFIRLLYENDKELLFFRAAVLQTHKFFSESFNLQTTDEKILFLTGGIMALVSDWINSENKLNNRELAKIIKPQVKLILTTDSRI